MPKSKSLRPSNIESNLTDSKLKFGKMRRNQDRNGDATSAAMLRRYSKLRSACNAIQEAAKVINENALNAEQISHLSKSDNELERAIADSPTILVSKYINEVHYGIQNVFQHYKFEEGAPNVDRVVKYPVVSNAYLENLAFLHRSCSSMNVHVTEVDRAVATNERLEFLGDSWLGAFVSYILYKKYPYANEGSLSKMRSAIVNNVNLAKWCKQVGFDERLRGNIPKMVNKLKDMTSKYHADCFEAYVGALVVDQFSVEFSEIVGWIEDLSEEVFKEMGTKMIKEPMNKNAKHELATLLTCNKVGARLEYQRLNSISPFKVEVKLGDISLATGEGSSIKEAEQRAAMKALLDTSKIKTYSFYELDDPQIEDAQVEEAELLLATSEQSTSSLEIDNSDKVEFELISKELPQKLPAEVSFADVAKKGRNEPKANGGIPQAQVADIVEQILGKLKDTVVTSVTTVMNEKGLIDQQTPKQLQEPLIAPSQAILQESIPHRQASTQNAPVRVTNLPANTWSQSIPDSFAPQNAQTRDVFRQYSPSQKNLTQIQNFTPESVPVEKVLAARPQAEMMVPAPPPAQSALTQPNTSSQTAARQYPIALSNSPVACTKAAEAVSAQASGHSDQLHVDASSKQELYAYLGQRGFRPYYETKSEGLQSFLSDCMIQGFNIILGSGRASSKKQAEQIAAYFGLRSESLKEFLESPAAYAQP